MGRKPRIWTAADRDYETLRIGMQTLFRHVGIETQQWRRGWAWTISGCNSSSRPRPGTMRRCGGMSRGISRPARRWRRW